TSRAVTGRCCARCSPRRARRSRAGGAGRAGGARRLLLWRHRSAWRKLGAIMRASRIAFATLVAAAVAAIVHTSFGYAQASQPDWAKVEDETMRHYQAVLRLDTRNPPGNEHIVADYLKQVLDKEGIQSQILGSDMNRANFIARLKGNGKRRPLLVM